MKAGRDWGPNQFLVNSPWSLGRVQIKTQLSTAASLFALHSAQNFKARQPALVNGYGTGLGIAMGMWPGIGIGIGGVARTRFATTRRCLGTFTSSGSTWQAFCLFAFASAAGEGEGGSGSGKFYGCSCQLRVYVILWPRLRSARLRLNGGYCL